jgi:hypothetical protein
MRRRDVLKLRASAAMLLCPESSILRSGNGSPLPQRHSRSSGVRAAILVAFLRGGVT